MIRRESRIGTGGKELFGRRGRSRDIRSVIQYVRAHAGVVR